MLFSKSKNLVFITYGDQRFKESRKRIVEEVRRLQLFSESLYESEIVQHEPEFKEALNNEEFRKTFNMFAFGYIWKPYIIQKHLAKLDAGDILVYVDAGCTIPANSNSRFYECFEMLRDERGVLVQKSKHLESETTKGDVFDYFGVRNDPAIYNTVKYRVGMHFIRKCAHSSTVYREWWNIAKTASYLFADSPSISPNFPNFVRHTWDTGTWSILCKKMGVIEAKELPVLVTRIKR